MDAWTTKQKGGGVLRDAQSAVANELTGKMQTGDWVGGVLRWVPAFDVDLADILNLPSGRKLATGLESALAEFAAAPVDTNS